MNKLILPLLLIAVAAQGQPRIVPARPGPVIITQPGTGTGTSGNASNVVLRGSVPGLVVTNATGDWSVTGNAQFATNGSDGNPITSSIYNSFTNEPAQHVVAHDYYHLWTAVQSNLPVRFLIVGDSVVGFNETFRGVMYAFDGWMSRGGYGNAFNQSAGGAGLLGGESLIFYLSLGGSATFPTTAGYWGNNYVAMPNNGTATTIYAQNANGVLANQLQINYWAGGTFGSFLVETQVNGGSYATARTVNAALGTGWQATNITLGLGYHNVRVTSTGTNNVGSIGLLDTTATNSHAWANMSIGGLFTMEILTNAGFWKFYTNYNPQVVFVEAKDTAAASVEFMNWLSSNITNSDVVLVTPSPNSDEGGMYAQRQQMISWARSNRFNLFDKYALFTPTNYWMPKTYTDGAHLSYKGIQMASTAFAKWFSASFDRFSLAGLQPIARNNGYVVLSNGISYNLTNRGPFVIKPYNDANVFFDTYGVGITVSWWGRTSQGDTTDWTFGGASDQSAYINSPGYIRMYDGGFGTCVFSKEASGGLILGNVYADQTDPGAYNVRVNGTFNATGTITGHGGGLTNLVTAAQTGTHSAPSTSNPLSPTWSTTQDYTVWYGATGTINLPAVATYANKSIIIYNTGAFTITIDANGSEVIVRDGTVQTGGVSMTLSSGAGNFVCLRCDGARWITLGYKGTLAQGS